VAGACLRHREGRRFLAFEQLEDVEAGTAAQQLRRELARLQRQDGGGEQIGQPARRAQADLAALGPVAVFGKLASDGSEVLARPDAAQGPRRPFAALGHGRDAGALGHRDEHLGDVQLGLGARRLASLLDPRIDLRIADADAAHDFSFANALDQHLVTDAVAKAGVRDALAAEPLAQLRDRELVLVGDAGDGTVDLGLVDLGAGLARIGDEHPLVDERVEDLLAQLGRRRQLRAVAHRLVADARHALLKLAGGDELLVDDGEDVVAGLRRDGHAGRGDGQRRQSTSEEGKRVSHTG
jgi:hypothetical protein